MLTTGAYLRHSAYTTIGTNDTQHNNTTIVLNIIKAECRFLIVIMILCYYVIMTLGTNDTQNNKTTIMLSIIKAECCFFICHYDECCQAECHYVECHYAECRGTIKT